MNNLWIKITGCMIAASVSLMATGPRITAAMFAEAKNEIVAVETPALYSMQQANGGLVFEIVTAALKAQNEMATLTTYPVEKMVDYYLTQEKVLGALGRAQEFSEKDKKGNIVVPLCRIEEHPNSSQPSFESTVLIIFNVKNSDTKAIVKKFKEGMNTILDNGQYQTILEKYEGKNPASATHLKQFKTLWKKELLKK